MQDESASVADQKKAALAELSVLRRYLKAGRNPDEFIPSALSYRQVDRIGKRAAEVGFAEAVEEERKSITLDSPLASGLVPFQLGPDPLTCRNCGTPLLGNPDDPRSEAAVGLCGDCQVTEATGSPMPSGKAAIAGPAGADRR